MLQYLEFVNSETFFDTVVYSDTLLVELSYTLESFPEV